MEYQNLDSQIKTIFKSWFIKFYQFDNCNLIKQNDVVKLPINWNVGHFNNIIEDIIAGDWGKEKIEGNYTKEVYCIRGMDILEVKQGNKGKMPIRFILPKNYDKKKLEANDIVIEISGGSPTQSTGRVIHITKSMLKRYDKDMVCTNFCKALKPKENYSMFLYYYWQYFYDINRFFAYENGTTGIKNLDYKAFINLEKIVIPPIDEILKFNHVVQPIVSKIFQNGLENEYLAKIRDTLLPKLMNGEIDLSKIEI
jgi:type I restriction enzyme S subunit